MKNIQISSQETDHTGFTIVELLVVISIIAILAALILSAIAHARVEALKKQARLEINQIATAIQYYDSAYSRFPVSGAVQNLALNSHNGQFTYGGSLFAPFAPATLSSDYTTNNSEVIAILMDITNTTVTTVNAKNPQGTAFLNAKMVGDTNSAGVGPDLVYRDPWKNPYIISVDLNGDNQCKDAFYSLSAVSGGGINGLILESDGSYACHGNVMVWSAGPDGHINANGPANTGANKDNILSWQ